LNQYHLGRKESESLFWIRNRSIPNNVFPIFWWKLNKKKSSRKPLFHHAK